MATNVSFNGVVYSVPSVGDDDWGDDVTNYLIAISTGSLQKSGGNFILTADVNFGATYGLKSRYFSSRSANIAASGVFRLPNLEAISWRNFANSADLAVTVNASNQLTFNGTVIQTVLSVSDTNSVDLTFSSNVLSADLKLSAAAAGAGFFKATNTAPSDGLLTLLPIAATAQTGVLSSTDWNTFDGKQGAGNYITALTGDVTATGPGSVAGTIAASVVTNAKLATMATLTIKGNSTGGTTNPSDLSVSTVTSMLNAFVGDSGAGGTKGLVPAPAAGDAAANKVLSAAGTWALPGTASPLTTKGDLYGYSSTNARIPVGTNGQGLVADSNQTLGARYKRPTTYNYILNSDAEVDTTGWATYANAAGAAPVTGAGGSPNVTWTRTTSTPLNETASFLFTKDAVNRQGQGVSYDFTIDVADQGSVLNIQGNYLVASGTYASGDLTAWVYDVTNATVIQLVPSSILNFGVVSKFPAMQFQSAINSVSYRLIFHVSTTSASAYTVKFDNIEAKANSYVYGAVITNMESYTPTWTSASTAPAIGNGTIAGRFQRIGDSARVRIYIATGSTTTFGSANDWTFSIPPGLSIDTAKLPATAESDVGLAQASVTTSGNTYDGVIQYASATTVLVRATDGVGSVGWRSTQPTTWTASTADQRIILDFFVPIVGWSSSVVVSSQAATNVVSFRGTNSGTQALTADVTRVAVTTVQDSVGAWDGDEYVVMVPGSYLFAVNVGNSAGSTSGFNLFIDGVSYDRIITSYATSAGRTSSGSLLVPSLRAGQRIDVRCDSTITGTAATISAFRLAGPAQIAASETVAARYTTAAGQSFTTATPAIIDFATKDYDTHSAVTTGASWKFTAPSSGKYTIQAQFSFAVNATGYRLAELRVNGVQKTTSSVVGSGTVVVTTQINDTVNLLTGDYVDVRAEQNSGGNLALTASAVNCSIKVVRVGNY